jgi:hypothetical protein
MARRHSLFQNWNSLASAHISIISTAKYIGVPMVTWERVWTERPDRNADLKESTTSQFWRCRGNARFVGVEDSLGYATKRESSTICDLVHQELRNLLQTWWQRGLSAKDAEGVSSRRSMLWRWAQLWAVSSKLRIRRKLCQARYTVISTGTGKGMTTDS